jgi:hypothetical protein
MKCFTCGWFVNSDPTSHRTTCADHPVHGPQLPPPPTCDVITRRGRGTICGHVRPCSTHDTATYWPPVAPWVRAVSA